MVVPLQAAELCANEINDTVWRNVYNKYSGSTGLRVFHCDDRDAARHTAAAARAYGVTVHVHQLQLSTLSMAQLDAEPTFDEAVKALKRFGWCVLKSLDVALLEHPEETAQDLRRQLEGAPTQMSIRLHSRPPTVLRSQNAAGFTCYELLDRIGQAIQAIHDSDPGCLGDHIFWEGLRRDRDRNCDGEESWHIRLGC